jgi:hypothetical protein
MEAQTTSYHHTSPLQLPFFSPLHVITLHFKISIQDYQTKDLLQETKTPMETV